MLRLLLLLVLLLLLHYTCAASFAAASFVANTSSLTSIFPIVVVIVVPGIVCPYPLPHLRVGFFTPHGHTSPQRGYHHALAPITLLAGLSVGILRRIAPRRTGTGTAGSAAPHTLLALSAQRPTPARLKPWHRPGTTPSMRPRTPVAARARHPPHARPHTIPGQLLHARRRSPFRC